MIHMNTLSLWERYKGMELSEPSLSDWWQDALDKKVEHFYPEVIGNNFLVDSWKTDGWNDGTTTLYGVYQCGGKYLMCSFPDYMSPSCTEVEPKFEHTGWEPTRSHNETRGD